MGLRPTYRKMLGDYLEPSGPNEEGEWYLRCPLHDDQTRSASINVEEEVFMCFAGCGGMPVGKLMREMKERGLDSPGATATPTGRAAKPDIPLGRVEGWHAALLADADRLKTLCKRRGLSKKTVKKFRIGWSRDDNAYTIPVFDADGTKVVNVRFYQFDVPDDRRKIWSVKGHGTPDLYPAQRIDKWGDLIIVCEGEWDALLTIQNGFDAVTRTASAITWKSNWNSLFENKIVFVCHDMDHAGQTANAKVVKQLEGVAKEVHVLPLPFPVTESHGKDLSDFWQEGHTPEDLYLLMGDAMEGSDLSPTAMDEIEEVEPVDTTVLDTFSSELAGRPVSMRVTITGKRFPTWLLPAEVHFTCDMEAPKCPLCPMNSDTGAWNGDHRLEISGSDPMILAMLDKNDPQVIDLLRSRTGIQKCGKLNTKVVRHMSVEELYVRPSVERSRFSTEAGDYTARKVLSVGRHDTMPNNTVEMIGAIRPNPQDQRNELQAWKVDKTETSIDRFEMTPAIKRQLKKFAPKKGQRPINKCRAIAEDLSDHVTRIYGRTNMHVLIDLAFHSMLALPYNGQLLERGWLDVLIIGDTRTGKSEATQKLIHHYGAGEFVSCEAASFAGIVGGLQQFGGREWSVTWGAVPLNDRRLVALDEVSGLTTEQIAQMSSIRSSGEAQLTKIQSERTFARTRLVWLGNPRDGGKLADRTFGVRSILPLIGNNEDVARFDLAMSVDERDVPPSAIDQDFEEKDEQIYGRDECAALVLWAWSRKPEHIVWEEGAERLCHTLGMELGQRYMSEPPLVQSANIRVKLARIAAAIAARTFSSPDGEQLLITQEHVVDAVSFMRDLYDAPDFGYGEQSKAIKDDEAEALEFKQETFNIVLSTPGLYEFLRDIQVLRADAVALACNMSREQATALISRLWQNKVLKDGPGPADFEQKSIMRTFIREIGAIR